MIKLHVRTIRSKIILSTVLFSLIFTLLTSGVIYKGYKDLLMKNMLEVTTANLKLVSDSLDEDLGRVRSLLEWVTVNSSLADILVENEINSQNGPAVADFIKRFSDMINSSMVDNSIEKVVIGGDTNVSMQMGTMYGSLQDVEICKKSSWFVPLYENPVLFWTGLEENHFQYASSQYIIPVVRPVYSYLKHRNVGFIMMGVNSTLPFKYLNKYSAYEDSEVMICNSSGQIIAHNDKSRIGETLKNYSDIANLIGGRTAGSITWQEGKSSITAVFQKSKVTGWYMIQKLSNTEISAQKKVIGRVIFMTVLGIFIMALLIFYALNYYINRPIKRLIWKIDRISEGDFSPQKDLETDDELGRIGVGINNMSESIREFMNKSVQDEKNKRELELKVLQTQVNPHFLYNTLNSIKWMAMIQKASGIGEMATALSHLLRNMAKGISNEIALQEELELVQDYVIIQQFRYGESFRVEYHIPEALFACKIIKFTLQPLIENAIFHGLEPKAGAGLIEVSAREEAENIIITIKDNGIGMEPSQIENIFFGKVQENKESLNGLGVCNVNERIKLVYGERYGITITSEPGEYTRVELLLPGMCPAEEEVQDV